MWSEASCHQVLTGGFVNGDPVDVSGKSLREDRCPPAAAARKETRLPQTKGGRWRQRVRQVVDAQIAYRH